MHQHKMTPALWYHANDGKLQQVIAYYAEIMGADFESDIPTPLGETPSGYAEIGTVRFFGMPYMIMSTAQEHHSFNDSVAFMIHCNDQQEIDRYWNYFTLEGKASMCGWCNDKFGLRWQIIPKNMAELMSRPNAQQVMYSQSKIIIAAY